MRNAGRRRIPKKAVTQDGIYEARKSCPLALAALVNADNLALQMCREELVVAIQGLRNIDPRNEGATQTG